MNLLKETRDLLTQNGYDTYFPSQHKGECTKPYIVIKLEGAVREITVSSERPIYTIMCYVPHNRYSLLEHMVLDIKQIMKGMYPKLMYLGNETASFYEEEIQGHMISFQYQTIRKISNWR